MLESTVRNHQSSFRQFTIFRALYEPKRVVFEVQDSGSGIPPDELPHIFTDFYRASNVGETPGAGLGLSIAKKIVDAHDGEIQVTNLYDIEGGTGTKFTVKIPRNLKTPEMRRREWSLREGEL